MFELPRELSSMNKKKRIGLLTIVIFIAGLIMTVIGAVVTVTYGVILVEHSTRAHSHFLLCCFVGLVG